jgi:hypothetical protein
MLTGVQDGGVLAMRSGAVTFESVAISDTSTRDVRVAGGGRSGPEAERGGGVQKGGVVTMVGGSVRFKGGSIARSTAVRDPRC